MERPSTVKLFRDNKRDIIVYSLVIRIFFSLLLSLFSDWLRLLFYVFLTALRQVSNAYHDALGINKLGTECFMLIMRPLMLCSAHEIQFNHLHHHRFHLNNDDIEAMSAKMHGPMVSYKTASSCTHSGRCFYKKMVVSRTAVLPCVVVSYFFMIQIDYFKIPYNGSSLW